MAYIIINSVEYELDRATNTAIVSDYSDDNGELPVTVEIPETINDETRDYKVVGIGYKAFKDANIESITLPSGIEMIDGQAFAGCSGLQYINIPNTVVTIGDKAFYGCERLKRITVPNTVTSIGFSAFEDCSSLQQIDLPFIGGNANATDANLGYIFGTQQSWHHEQYVPESLQKVNITGPITYLGPDAFYGCSNLQAIFIPNSIESIDYAAFEGCDNLHYTRYDNGYYMGNGNNPHLILMKAKDLAITTCKIHNRTKIFYAEPFVGCSQLAEIVVSEANEYYCVIDGVLYTKDKQKLVLYPAGKTGDTFEVPSWVETIRDLAFLDCINIHTLKIADSVTEIGNYSLDGCKNITSITLGKNLTLRWPEMAPLFDSESLQEIQGECLNACTNNGILYNKDGTSLWRYPRARNVVNFEIPANVTRIEQKAFSQTLVKKVQWMEGKDGTLALGYKAFEGASRLEQAIFESSIQLDRQTFNNCKNLQTLKFTSGTQFLNADAGNPDYSYQTCTSLDEVICPAGGLYSIQWAPNITTLTITNGTIHQDVFLGHKNIQTVTIDSDVGVVKTAFRKCTSLSEIIINNTEIQVSDNPFQGCPNITTAIIPSSMIEKIPKNQLQTVTVAAGDIPERAFAECKSLIEVNINSTHLASIGSQAFSKCTNLSTCSIPSTIVDTVWGNRVFEECSSLQSITIPPTTSKTGVGIFYGCKKLTSITAPFVGSSLTEDRDKEVISDLVNTLKSWFAFWSDSVPCFWDPDNLTTFILTKDVQLAEGAFSNYNTLQAIQLLGTITTIPDRAFDGCTSLRCVSNNIGKDEAQFKINLPNLTTIDDYAFQGCSSIKSFEFPNSLETIGVEAFKGCTSLKQIVSIGNESTSQLTTIGERAFENCHKLEDVSFIETVSQIGSQAFKDCQTLTEVVVPDGVSYQAGVFQGCNNITTITLPDIGIINSSMPHLGEIFGSQNPKTQSNFLPRLLQEVEITNATIIPEYAFYECSSLVNIIVNDSITTIEEHAFDGCTQLQNINIPNIITVIKDYAFAKCLTLTAFVLPSSIQNLGQHIITGSGNIIELSIIGKENATKTLKSHNNCIVDNNGRILYGCAAGSFPEDSSIATSVGEYAFEGIDTLLTLTIPEGFTAIEPRAFTGCSKLQEVFIPNSVTSIGANAFENCYSLTAITLPFVGSGHIDDIESNQLTPNQLFGSIFNDAGSESDPIPEGLVRVIQTYKNGAGGYRFLIPSKLKRVHITKTASQSDGMSGIPTEVIKLSNVSDIGPFFFAENAMSRIDIDNSLKNIRERAFDRCQYLTSITLPSSFSTIEQGAFKDTPSMAQMLVYANKWSIPTGGINTFHDNTKIYMATLPSGNKNFLPRNSYVARTVGDRDFLGFWFNGFHSIDDLGVYRTGDGMHNASLTAKTETTTVNVPGSNGMYYFGTYDRSRAISVNFAFDHMTEKQLRVWKNLCSSKDLGELVFDEAPYKVYTAKITGTPKLQYIPFTEGGERIYKGKGTIEFTCYYPYAHTPNSDTKMFKNLWTPINKNADAPDFAVRGTCLDAYFDASFPVKHEWAGATRMPEEPTIGVNPGDLPAPFLLKTLASVHNGTELQVGDAKITIKQDTTKPVHWDSRSGLVYTFDEKGGKKPIYYSGNSIATIPVTDEPIEWSSIADLEYDYWYY